MNKRCSNIKNLALRLELVYSGYSKGVSANWISKKNNYIFENFKQFEASSRINTKLFDFNYFLQGQTLHANLLNSTPIFTSSAWNSEANLSGFLYSYILTNKPKIIIETGVANGISTRIILTALEKVGGYLHSFDILPEAEKVAQNYRNWKFHLLPKRNTKSHLENSVKRIGFCDLWLHDSNHGSNWQTFEYNLALQQLNPSGILFSDDIDASPAWGNFSKNRKNPSIAIFDSRKFFGFTLK
jgi:predicted O-methyltransferase YrrM